MTAIAFDTLRFAGHLTSAGVPENQAKAQTEALTEALSGADRELATKNDAAALRLEMREMEHRLTIRMVGIAFAQTTLTVALLGLMLKLLVS
ncbi:MAG: DUF1640 domain-containing protein [Gammaproteobacteria bacterium]|nr:DUF1640 domain-containing protein [Gammaproteobacteria bacterium]